MVGVGGCWHLMLAFFCVRVGAGVCLCWRLHVLAFLLFLFSPSRRYNPLRHIWSSTETKSYLRQSCLLSVVNITFLSVVALSSVSLTLAILPCKYRHFGNPVDPILFHAPRTSFSSVSETISLYGTTLEYCLNLLNVALFIFKKGSISRIHVCLWQLKHLATVLSVLCSSKLDQLSTVAYHLRPMSVSSILVCNRYWSKSLLVCSCYNIVCHY